MIILSVVLILLLIAYAVFFNLIGSLTSILMTEEGPEMPADEMNNEQIIEQNIAYYESTTAELEEGYKTEKNGYTLYPQYFSSKAKLTAYKYMRDHNLYEKDVKFLGVNYDISVSADGFASNYMSVVTSIIAIYAIVVGAGLLADEYKNGTIKLLLTRPITKNQLITAKLLAALTISLGMASLFSLVGFIYGLIAFDAETTSVIYLVFNATSVTKSTVGAYLFGTYVISLLKIATMCLLAYFIGTLARKKTTGIIVTIIIHLGIISAILGLLPIEIGLLTPNMDLTSYFVAGSSVPIYGNFFISLAVYIVYLAAMTFGLYFTVNKRDVI